jgi:hypothetical protein
MGYNYKYPRILLILVYPQNVGIVKVGNINGKWGKTVNRKVHM